MKFRSPTDQPIRVALTTGHVAVVGSEWRELPTHMHREALAAGCESSDAVRQAPGKPTKEPAGQGNDEASVIRRQLQVMLEREGTEEAKDDFTAAGMPNLNVLSGLCGFKVDKVTMGKVWAELKAEAGA